MLLGCPTVRACEGCQTATSEAELTLSPAGQWLCRRCQATYESRVATRRVRSAEVARRCSCGNVVAPMGDEDEVDEEGNYFMFQSGIYSCGRCGTEYRVYHPVVMAVLVFALAAFIAGARRAEDPNQAILAIVAVVLVGAYVGYQIFKWFRYPRVP